MPTRRRGPAPLTVASQARTLLAMGDLPDDMREVAFENLIVRAARMLGHLRHAERPAMRQSGAVSTPIKGDKGWPDLVLLGRGRLVIAELKKNGEHPTPEQRVWLVALADAGVETYVWRPADWRSSVVPVLNGQSSLVGRVHPSANHGARQPWERGRVTS